MGLRVSVRRRSILTVVSASVLIINVDNTILNVALPTLVSRLHATSTDLQWIVDAYSMVFAGLLLVAGSLADRFGRKLFFLLGLGVFALGSLGAATSASVQVLIAWRAVMGAGAAGAIPSSLSIINDVFREPAQRARAIGAWGGTIGLGIAIGPIAGGVLLAHFWWGSIFIVNLPIALCAFVAALGTVPDPKNPVAQRPDAGGAVLSTAGLALLLWAVIEAPLAGWTSTAVLATGCGSLVVLALFALFELRSGHPLLDLSLFRARRFSIPAASESLATFGLLGALFLQTQVLQFDMGYDPLQAGERILPVAGLLVLSAPLAPYVARLVGVRVTIAAGLAAIAAGLLWGAAVSSVSATYLSFLPSMLLIGFGTGMLLPSATNSVVGAVPRGDAGVGSAVNSVSLQLGGAVGVAVIGSVLSTRYRDSMTTDLAGRAVPAAALHNILGSLGGALAVAKLAGGAIGVELGAAARSAFMGANSSALAVGGGVALAGACLVLALLSHGERRTDRKGAAPDPSPRPAGAVSGLGRRGSVDPDLFADRHDVVRPHPVDGLVADADAAMGDRIGRHE